MKYDRLTASTRAVLKKLPFNLSTESVARAYNLDPLIVELERPKPPKTIIGHRPDDEPIAHDGTHKNNMRDGSEKLRKALHAAYAKRHWADPHGWGAVYCGMRP
jgi:hypothetical protein